MRSGRCRWIVRQRLAARGYEQYEVSAYARPGRRSRHNLNYWQFGDYLGIGAGAHGKLTSLASDERARFAIVRSARVKQPREFLRRAAAERISDRFEVDDRGPAVRVHVECAAADRRLRRSAISKRAPASRSRRSRATLAEAQRKRLLEQTAAGELASDGAGPAVLERPAGAVPAGAGGRRAVGCNDGRVAKVPRRTCVAACKFVN